MNWMSKTTGVLKHGSRARPLAGIAAVLALLPALSACNTPRTPPPQPITTYTNAPPPAVKPAGPIQKTALSGKSLVIQSYLSLNADCSSMGKSTVRVLEAPAHGNMTFADDVAYPTFDKENQRYVCNTKQVPATNAIYQSDPGFYGNDSVKLEIIFPSGSYRTDTFTLSVK